MEFHLTVTVLQPPWNLFLLTSVRTFLTSWSKRTSLFPVSGIRLYPVNVMKSISGIALHNAFV